MTPASHSPPRTPLDKRGSSELAAWTLKTMVNRSNVYGRFVAGKGTTAKQPRF